MKKLVSIVLFMLFMFTGFAEAKQPFRSLPTERIMALALYGESRDESTEGKLAVATVILNRQRLFGLNIHDVILQKNQFSPFMSRDRQYQQMLKLAKYWPTKFETKKELMLYECLMISRGLITNTMIAHQKIEKSGAAYFKAVYCRSSFHSGLIFVARIGNHQFYTKNSHRMKIQNSKPKQNRIDETEILIDEDIREDEPEELLEDYTNEYEPEKLLS